MKVLQQIFFSVVIALGLAVTAMAQKDGPKKPPKDPPPVINPQPKPPPEKPPQETKPKKPRSAMAIWKGDETETA